MFQELTVSPSSVCAGGLEEPKLITRCPTLSCIYIYIYISIWPGAGWNATPLFGGRSLQVVAHGQICLLLVKESVSVKRLLAAMYNLIQSLLKTSTGRQASY